MALSAMVTSEQRMSAVTNTPFITEVISYDVKNLTTILIPPCVRILLEVASLLVKSEKNVS